ncbi:hypothetical protein BpHYR1_027622, partial [Brachionus plicatilis]
NHLALIYRLPLGRPGRRFLSSGIEPFPLVFFTCSGSLTHLGLNKYLFQLDQISFQRNKIVTNSIILDII